MMKNAPETKTLLIAAGLIVSLFLGVHLAGLRQMTGTLSGMLPATELELTLGLVYVVCWFGVVLVAPILFVAAGLRLALGRLATVLARGTGDSLTSARTIGACPLDERRSQSPAA